MDLCYQVLIYNEGFFKESSGVSETPPNPLRGHQDPALLLHEGGPEGRHE